MPEGVEVKISADLIKPHVIGKQVGIVICGDSGRYANNPPEGYDDFLKSFRDTSGPVNIVNECRITDVSVKGKFMYWTFDNGWYMFSTFGMTGQWSPTPGKHVCLQIRLHDATGIKHVYFNDPRHFGTIKFTNRKSDLTEKISELGWDPLNRVFDSVYQNFMVAQLQGKKKCIGEVLMDQSVFAGVGNYIRAEALYLAKLSPWRICKTLSKVEILTLCQALVDVMKESYSYQGATILTYKDAYGAEGKYSSCFKVYGQATDPLGNIIVRETTPEGRTIHWCPTVQI
jgi:formamidopyrimidine-DNA glycosylase